MAGKVFYFLLLCSCSLSFCHELELKQVLVLSRHNLRTPLANHLVTMSPRPCLKWDQPPAELTKKGALLEGYYGQYFADWLSANGLFQYLDKDSIYIYANTKQRTKATAVAFASAFRNYNVEVVYKNTTEVDPIFDPIVHNATDAFKQQVYEEMNKFLAESDLQDIYVDLNRILNLRDSQICKEKSYCDLVNDKTDIYYEVGQELDVVGPLGIGNVVVDAFLMSYYEGVPLNDIAWGEIQSEEYLGTLTKVVRDNQKVRFGLPKSSRDAAKPLAQYIKEMLKSNKKFIYLVGHDSNLNSIFSTLEFDSFVLPGKFESAPIGAKLVFQRWSDGVNDFLKVEYVYSSFAQIRNAEKLTLINPPKNITMHFKNRKENGLYPWSDFEKILENVTE